MSWATIEVQAENPYQVLIGSGVSRLLGDYLDGAHRVAVIHAEGARLPAFLADLPQQLTAIPIPDAEAGKTATVVARCWGALADAGFTRSDAVVGLGGGATTDTAGFVAATWLRGVKYVALPTSLLAMVDAAIGGKTGINLASGKNLVGAFYEPFAVLADLDFLTTLPPEQLRSGTAEILKCGFIRDARILEVFESDPEAAINPGSEVQADLITRAVAVKAAVVGADLRERGAGPGIGREALNYGHTLGHAIEVHQQYRWAHGQAVSVGMVYAAELASGLGLIDAGLLARHRHVLRLAGLPTSYPATSWAGVRPAMDLDKKARGTTLRFVVLQGLGRPTILTDPPDQALIGAFLRLDER